MNTLRSLRTWSVDLHFIRAWLVAVLAAGMVGGVWSRISMRIVAIVQGQTPDFSIAGTVGILLIHCMAVALVVAAIQLARRLQPLRPRVQHWAAIVLLYGLFMPLFNSVASSDVPGADRGQIMRLLLLFVPIPGVMGYLSIQMGRRAEARARKADVRIGVGWLVALLVAAFFFTLSMVSLGEAYIRHPQLVGRLLGAGANAMSELRDRFMMLVMLFFPLWLALAAMLAQRDLNGGRRPWRSLALLLLPILLLHGAAEMPEALGWLPNTAWMHGLVVALGLAIFVALILDAQRERLPAWARWGAIAGYGAAAIWLAAGGNAGVRGLPAWTEWLTWGILALTLLPALLLPSARAGEGALHTALLTALVASWLLLWLAAMSLPALMLRNQTGFATSLSLPLFWLLWLLLPAALLVQGRTLRIAAPAAIGQPG